MTSLTDFVGLTGFNCNPQASDLEVDPLPHYYFVLTFTHYHRIRMELIKALLDYNL
jgi:hypothetical protein